MSTIIFVLSGIILGLVIMSKIPGLEHFVKPTIDLLFTFIKFLCANASAWAVYFFKMFVDSHLDLLKHLSLSADAIDPSMKMKKNAA
ncbi:hypothetical protein F6X40_17350 [Paraburkholderia sp. UCT31]|uniref:hypothetical protein n=1 Tax=Paraburkholderia sp. UCT31 TaxID=2615209 RepID=UPI0016553808|nr:hypothetical protein [Paraburkholderia sp. UCT31]MBC8738528.1 hypothetical protein [Paraburkholderia sp. UCT31]